MLNVRNNNKIFYCLPNPLFLYGTVFMFFKEKLVFMFCYDWWLYMVINITVQYNGGFLPDIIPLTQGYDHWGTRLKTMQWLRIYSLCNSILLLPCLMMYYNVFVFAVFLVSLHGD